MRLSLALAATALAAACSPPKIPSLFAPDVEIRNILADRVDYYGNGGGIVAGLVGPGERRVVAYGVMREGGPPVDGDTLFDIASSTKGFTALLLADMAQTGELSLDDPASKHLEARMRMPVQAGGRTITLRDLAMFTSTLPFNPANLTPADPRNPFADYTLEMQEQFLAAFELSYPIGSRVAYSNAGYNLLGQALSHRAGKPFEVLLKDRVLDPLGMRDTLVINGQEAPAPFTARLATGHGEDQRTSLHADHQPDFYGSGALTSTANDLLDLLEALAGLKQTELAPAIAGLTQVKRATWIPDTLVGLGWGVTQRNERTIVWRAGGHEGFQSWIGFDPEAKIGVVVLANSRADVSDVGFHLLDPRSPLEPQVKRVSVPQARLDAFAGVYRLPDGKRLTIQRDGDNLVWALEGYPWNVAVAYSDRSFLTPAFDAQFTFDFESEDQAHPARAVFYQAGNVEIGERVGDDERQ